ncbi:MULTISPECIES: hypothetical protein [unclassified Vibrio]|uniref:hypothetical protein n=1 Tax=Vibrio TaxID=662 RepID=UPI00354C9DDF
MRHWTAPFFLSLAMLLGCSDDDKEQPVDTPWSPSQQEIQEIIEFRNGVSTADYTLNKATVRWRTDELIPLYFVSESETAPPEAIIEAIELVHGAIGYPVIDEAKSFYHPLYEYKDEVLNISNGQFNDAAFYQLHEIDRGIIIGHNTHFSMLSKGTNSYCISTANAPFSTQLLTHFDPDTHYYHEQQKIWFNYSHPRCETSSLTKEAIATELVRALGLQREFLVGQWWSDTFSKDAQTLIRTLYSHSSGTPFNKLN